MNKLRKDDVCIIENGERFPKYNGAEVTIIEVLDHDGPVYKIDLRNPQTGKYFGCRRHQLRLKGKPTPEEREYTALIERLKKPMREAV